MLGATFTSLPFSDLHRQYQRQCGHAKSRTVGMLMLVTGWFAERVRTRSTTVGSRYTLSSRQIQIQQTHLPNALFFTLNCSRHHCRKNHRRPNTSTPSRSQTSIRSGRIPTTLLRFDWAGKWGPGILNERIGYVENVRAIN